MADRLPSSTQAAAMLAADRLGRKPRLRIRDACTWPGGTAAFRLRILNVDEVQLARAAAVHHFKKALKWDPDALNADEFNEETMVQILARAIEQPVGPDRRGEPLFASADELRTETVREELVEIWGLYCDLRDQTEDEPIGDELLEQVIALVKKKDEQLLRQLAPSTLRACLRSTVDRLESSLTARSSSTSSSSASTTDSSSDDGSTE